MSIETLLVNASYAQHDPQVDLVLEENLISELLNEFRIQSQISIDRLVDGDLNRFAELVDEMQCIIELEHEFPGIRDYLTHHILEGIDQWDDRSYCRCVAIGLMRYIGRNPLEAMG